VLSELADGQAVPARVTLANRDRGSKHSGPGPGPGPDRRVRSNFKLPVKFGARGSLASLSCRH
jgi:hypothetical protein